MIDKTHDLPVIRQVQLLELSRSSIYYQAQPTSESDLKLANGGRFWHAGDGYSDSWARRIRGFYRFLSNFPDTTSVEYHRDADDECPPADDLLFGARWLA